MPCVGAKEPVSIKSKGYALHLFAFLSYTFDLTGQVMGKFSPRSYFMTK